MSAPADILRKRDDTIESIGRDPLDVLVIGGGIVGAGAARDAAMRGLRTALVERNDFASGTSSRSSRLLHGGLRYLAQGHIGLVREASVEKMIVHRIAPHLAAPLPFLFPTRRGSEWKKWKLRIGVKIYDLLCGKRNLGKSSALSESEMMHVLPMLSTEALTGGVRYFDGMTNDARLVIDTLRSASAGGARLVNYAAIESPARSSDQWICRMRDQRADRSVEVRARCIINATGAWADKFSPSRVKLRLTKGVHLVIERSRLPIGDAVVMTEGKRILFAIPWGDRVILGTTDTDFSGPTDAPMCEPQDLQYVLSVTNRTFPAAKLSAGDVISTWAGLRPLVSSGAQGAPSDISRAHEIHMTEPGWFDVTGGKLTTHRLMTKETIDKIIKFAGMAAKPCTTATTSLLDDPHPPFSGIFPPDFSRQAVAHFCEREWAIHLEDVMIRRTSWRYARRDHLAMAGQVSRWMGDSLGWDEQKASDELANYAQKAEDADRRAGISMNRDGDASFTKEFHVHTDRIRNA